MVPKHKRRSFTAESLSSGPECSKERMTGVSEGVPSTPARTVLLTEKPGRGFWTKRHSREERGE